MKAVAAVLCLAVTVQAAEADALFPAGAWYAEQRTPVETVYSISHYETDGSFSNDFRECWRGGSRDHTEKGRWSATAGVMHEVTENISGRSVNLTADYEVSNEGNEWTIHVVGGDAFRIMGPLTRRLTHLADGATLPPCDAVS